MNKQGRIFRVTFDGWPRAWLEWISFRKACGGVHDKPAQFRSTRDGRGLVCLACLEVERIRVERERVAARALEGALGVGAEVLQAVLG
jgi:hypothetical protein